MAAHPEVAFARDIIVRTTTLSDWCIAEGISQIDTSWLDLQGMELPVLKASPDVFKKPSYGSSPGGVPAGALRAGFGTYKEVAAWMSGHGFVIAVERVTTFFGNVLFVRA